MSEPTITAQALERLIQDLLDKTDFGDPKMLAIHQADTAPGWTVEAVKLFEFADFFPDAKRVPHILGYIVSRECGCQYVLGMRLDKHEPTSGFAPCPEHGQICALVLHALKTMEPSDEPVIKLATEMFESAL
jgi:hypothetical protein